MFDVESQGERGEKATEACFQLVFRSGIASLDLMLD